MRARRMISLENFGPSGRAGPFACRSEGSFTAARIQLWKASSSLRRACSEINDGRSGFIFMNFRIFDFSGSVKLIVALIPILGCGIIIGLRHWNFGIYRYLFTEDGLFEYLTSAIYFSAAAFAAVIALTFQRKGQFIMAAAYLLLTLSLFFVAGEEISWGQRILDFETPPVILEKNTQQELTIHNLEPIQRILHAIYIVIGAYGAFLWLATLPNIPPLRAHITPYVAPRWYLSTYFLPVFFLYTHLEMASRETAWFQYRHPDQEPAEFIMSLGFLLFVLSNRFRQILDLSLDKGQILNVTWRSSI